MRIKMMNMKTALYRHFDKNGDLLYVGISLSVLKRLGQHAKHSSWFNSIEKVTIEHFENREAAIEAEKKAIQDEKPIYNIYHARSSEKTKFKANGFKPAQISLEKMEDKILLFDANYTIDEAARFLKLRRPELMREIERGKIRTWSLPPLKELSIHGTPMKPKVFITGFQMIEYLEHLSER